MDNKPQGDLRIIEALNWALTIELTAKNQYSFQASSLKKRGCLVLAKKMHDESVEKMDCSDKLIERISALGGRPDKSRYDKVRH